MVCSEEVTGSDEIKILPLGLVKSQKGEFIVDEESLKLMKEHFVGRGLDIVVDYEHQTLENVQAPAGGWIKDFYIKDNSIVAKVEWTKKASEYIANKEYRYLSPVVMVRKSDNKAVVLHSVALTNTPAIDNMFTIVNSLDLADEKGGNLMDLLNQLISMLGLDAGATESDVIEKLKVLMNTQNKEVVANKDVLNLLDLKEDATKEEVTNSIMALKKPVDTNIETELKALKEQMAMKDANELVELALKQGKITPAQKDWATQYALTSKKGFEEYMSNAPQSVPMGEFNYGNGENQKMSPEYDTKVCKMLGLDEADVKKYGGVN